MEDLNLPIISVCVLGWAELPFNTNWEKWIMKRIIATGILGCLLLGAGAAGAGGKGAGVGPVSKFTFEVLDFCTDQECFPLTIRAGTKTVKKASYTVCGYFVYPTDEYLGGWEDNVRVEANDVLNYCLSNYKNRS